MDIDFKQFAVSETARLDQSWSECLALFSADPERMIRLWTTLGGGDLDAVRELSDEDLRIVATLCMLSFNELTKLAAERMAEALEQ